jgi:glycosyltransferase involved in cell wall biosynthesis
MLRDRRGIGRYVREVVRRFVHVEDLALTLLVDAPFPQLVRSQYREQLGSEAFALARRAPRNCDVVWHPWNGTFLAANAPAVATIHDVVPFAYPASDGRKRLSQQQPFLRSAERSAAILTDSQFSAGEIERRLGVAPWRIWTIPLGVGLIFSPGPVPAEAARSGDYILVLGTDEPHKNVRPLAQGAARALEGRQTRLAGLGPSLPAGPVFERRGPADEMTLVDLYRGALFLAAPGLYEGFGLPLLEAMACGTPVLASRAGSYPEVCGEAAAYVDEPEDPLAWAAAIASLHDDPERRSALREEGLRRASAFTWERTAASTLDVLRAHARPGEAAANASAARS